MGYNCTCIMYHVKLLKNTIQLRWTQFVKGSSSLLFVYEAMSVMLAFIYDAVVFV